MKRPMTVAAARWAAGSRSWRTTRGGTPRGLFCGIGVCYDCLTDAGGIPGQRACLTPASPPTASPPPAHEPVTEGRYDVAVIGAGPAGLAAAAAAATAGCRVVLADEAPQPGGQFWRGQDPSAGGTFGRLMSMAGTAAVTRLPGPVWFVEPGFTIHTAGRAVTAGRVVIATGAHDRPLPFPGWDLPGVVTPGGAQALLKGSGVVVGRRVAVAGAGPFLLAVAAGLAAAGAEVVGVFEAGDPRRYLRRPMVLASVPGKLTEAGRYAAALARHRVPYRTRHAVVAARGDGAVSEVEVTKLARDGHPAGRRWSLACDALAVGYGFTARLELALALGCDTRIGADGGLALAVDAAGRTSVPGVFAAGEVTGVGGAELAMAEGELAGRAAAADAGHSGTGGRAVARLVRRQRSLRRFAGLMHEVHAPPAGWPQWCQEQTLICRCEEVPYRRLREAVADLAATDGRAVKLLARPGMGWCQGRICGYPAAALTAQLCHRDIGAGDLLAFAHRPLAAPVLLADLAHGGEPGGMP